MGGEQRPFTADAAQRSATSRVPKALPKRTTSFLWLEGYCHVETEM
jgi:hypothetical protein